MTQHQNFLNSLIQRIRMGRSNKKVSSPESLIKLCSQLVSKNGEATLFSLAKIILEDFLIFQKSKKSHFSFNYLISLVLIVLFLKKLSLS